MKLKLILVSLVILTGLFLTAFGLPTAPQTVQLQNTAPPPAVTPVVTVVGPTVIVQTATPGAVPVTGGPNPTIWTIILFGLLALLALAFLVALFSPRASSNEPIDRNPPPPPEV